LPPVIWVTSTVWPVRKSKTGTFGVAMIGSLSWPMVGRALLVGVADHEGDRPTGLQFTPPPTVVRPPKSDRSS
jgi:hypothetical protein